MSEDNTHAAGALGGTGETYAAGAAAAITPAQRVQAMVQKELLYKYSPRYSDAAPVLCVRDACVVTDGGRQHLEGFKNVSVTKTGKRSSVNEAQLQIALGGEKELATALANITLTHRDHAGRSLVEREMYEMRFKHGAAHALMQRTRREAGSNAFRRNRQQADTEPTILQLAQQALDESLAEKTKRESTKPVLGIGTYKSRDILSALRQRGFIRTEYPISAQKSSITETGIAEGLDKAIESLVPAVPMTTDAGRKIFSDDKFFDALDAKPRALDHILIRGMAIDELKSKLHIRPIHNSDDTNFRVKNSKVQEILRAHGLGVISDHVDAKTSQHVVEIRTNSEELHGLLVKEPHVFDSIFREKVTLTQGEIAGTLIRKGFLYKERGNAWDVFIDSSLEPMLRDIGVSMYKNTKGRKIVNEAHLSEVMGNAAYRNAMLNVRVVEPTPETPQR